MAEELNYNYPNSANSVTTIGSKDYHDRNYADRLGSAATSPIKSQYGQLEQGLAGLHAKIEDLEGKLQSVLGPERPMPENGESQVVQPTLSPFAENIRSDADRVQRLIGRLSEITARLEL